MKKTYLILFALVCSVFVFSNFKQLTTISNVVFVNLNGSPDLPDVPYDYSNIEFPAHLLDRDEPQDTVIVGYGSGGIDSSAFFNVTDHGATLGRVLFYDEKLSALENISCASCHVQSLSFADDVEFSEGVSAPTKRNSMNLNDIAWTNSESFFWDMSQSNLHQMIQLPLTDENEIGADIDDVALKLSLTDYYPQLFTNAFGDPAITEERVVDALVQFLESMTTFNSRFDQAAENDFEIFTQQERDGQEIFAQNCATCHSQGSHLSSIFGGEIFIDPGEEGIFQFFPFIFSNGLPLDEDDKGAGEWMPGFDNLFKIPTLRNAELTGPYMHDGRFTTLEEVIQFYSEETEENEWNVGFIEPGGFQFNDYEKESLLAFLKTLTDHTFADNPKWSDPFKLVNTTPTELEVESLVMSPNPMADQSIIEWQNDNNELTSITVFDSSGKALFTDRTQGNTYTLYKNNLVQGMYVIELVVGDKRSSRRMIVQ